MGNPFTDSRSDDEVMSSILGFKSPPPPQPDTPLLSDMATGVKRGLFTAVPDMVGGAMKAFSPVDSGVYRSGQDLQDSAKAIAGLPEMQKSNTKRGIVGSTLVAGAEGIGQMVPVIAGSILNPLVGAGIAASMYGGSTYQDTKERMLEQEGLNDAYAAANPGDPRVTKAKATGVATGLVQGAGEAGMSYLGGRFFKGVFPQFGKQTAEGIVKGIATPGVSTVKNFGKAWGTTIAGEGFTEALQDEGQASVERLAGLKDAPAFLSQAVDSAKGGIGTAVLLGPLAGAGHYKSFRNAQEIQRALADPAVDPVLRVKAALVMGDEIAKVDEVAARNFMDHAHDAIGDLKDTGSAPYAMDLNNESLLKPFSSVKNPAGSTNLIDDIPDFKTDVQNSTTSKTAGTSILDDSNPQPVAGVTTSPKPLSMAQGIDAGIAGVNIPLAAPPPVAQQPSEIEQAIAWSKQQIQLGGNGHLMQGNRMSDANYTAYLVSEFRKAQENANASTNLLSNMQGAGASQMDRPGMAVPQVQGQVAGVAGYNSQPGDVTSKIALLQQEKESILKDPSSRNIAGTEVYTPQALKRISEINAQIRYHEVSDVTPSGSPTPLDAQAHDAATSPTNDTPEPTPAQIEAGNYKKGHVNLHGLDISIENPAGSLRKGVDENGKQWQTKLAHHYGYIKGTVGKDKDHVDVFVGPNPESGKVFVVDQRDTKTGKLDEHKTMLGFDSLSAARAGYLANYDKSGPQRIMSITETTVDGFKKWLKNGDQRKEFSTHKPDEGITVKTVPASKATLRRQLDPAKDSILVAIAKLGGIARDDIESQMGNARELSHTLNGMATKGAGQLFHVISTKGRPLDAIRELLVEYGYLSESSTVNDLLDKLDSSSRGTVHGSIHSADAGIDSYVEAEQRYTDMIADMTEEEYAAFTRNQWLDEQSDLLAEAEAIIEEYLTEQYSDDMAAADWQAVEKDFEEALDATEFNEGTAEKTEGEVQTPAPGSTESVPGIVQADSQNQDQESAAEPAVELAPPAKRLEDLTDEEIAALPEAKVDHPVLAALKESQATIIEKAKIQDFGEKIGGARKDFAEKFAEAKNLDVATESFSKTWPEPDYNKMIQNGFGRKDVDLVRALRDEIPDKPRKSWKVKPWVELVKSLRGHAESVMNGDGQHVHTVMERDKVENRAVDNILGRADLYSEVGHDVSLRGVTFARNHWQIYKGLKNVWMWQVLRKGKSTAFGNMPEILGEGETRERAVSDFKTKLDALQPSGKKLTEFSIYSYRDKNKPGFYIGKKIGKDYVDLKHFDTSEEARAYRKGHQSELEAQLAAIKNLPNERRSHNEPRSGTDYRAGKDVTPEMFSHSFGFRGVEFGNYVEGAKRQQDLNNAFDALYDLASLLNIPTKAVSLNGELGLAFGSRGKGGKDAPSAHYEADKVVINLTKNNGAGSLAHEWFHSLDNYISRNRGYKDKYITDSAVKYGEQDQTRQELIDAFKNLGKALDATNLKARSRELDKTRTKQYWSNGIEMHARAFENYVIDRLLDSGINNDYLANINDTGQYAEALLNGFYEGKTVNELYPYLLDPEKAAVAKAFDNLFATFKTKETDKGVALYSNAMLDPRAIAASLSGLKANLQEDLPKLVSLGQRVVSGGARTYQQFVTGIKKYLGDKWSTFKNVMLKVYHLSKEAYKKSPLNNEVGAIGDVDSVLQRVTMEAEERTKGRKPYEPSQLPRSVEVSEGTRGEGSGGGRLDAAHDARRGQERVLADSGLVRPKQPEPGNVAHTDEQEKFFRALKDGEEVALQQWAEENNKVLPGAGFKTAWIRDGKLGETEHKIAFSPDGKTLRKFATAAVNHTWLDYLNRLAIHNSLFPETAYTFKGVSELDGQFHLVVDQARISGNNIVEATREDIASAMVKLGFRKTLRPQYRNKPAYADLDFAQMWVRDADGIVVFDVGPKNVYQNSETGQLFFIDPMIEAIPAAESTANFKLGDKSAKSVKLAEAQAWVKTLPISRHVNVVQSVSDLPQAARDEIEKAQVDPAIVHAMELRGTIHVVADNVPNMQRVKALVIGHELAHAGQSEKIVDLSVGWYKRTVNSKSEQTMNAHAILKRVAENYGYDLSDENQYRRAVQEATAAIAEQAATEGWKPPGLIQRLFMYIKHWLRQKGLISHVSDAELSLAVAEMLRIGEKRLSVGAAHDEDMNHNEPFAQFALAPSVQSVVNFAKEAFGENFTEGMGKKIGQSLNPLDFSRMRTWFESVSPDSVKHALGWFFGNPVYQAERDPHKQPFVEAGIQREEDKTGFRLAFMGWDGSSGEASTLLQRAKETYGTWTNPDKATAWGRIQSANAALSADEQLAVNGMLVEGDRQSKVYSTLEKAMTNPRIAAMKPSESVFKVYKDVRNHIDTVVANERERIFTEMSRKAGVDEETIKRHINDYRQSLSDRPGWLPRNHGEGKHQVNVYRIIDKLAFDVKDIKTDGHGDNSSQAYLPYYAGPQATDMLTKIVEEINKKYSEIDKAKRIRFGSFINGKSLMPNGQMVVSGSKEDIAQFLKEAEGVVSAVIEKNKQLLADLEKSYAEKLEQGSTRADLKELELQIKSASDTRIRVKVYMQLHESKSRAEKVLETVREDMKAAMPINYRPADTYESDYRVADGMSESAFGDLSGDFAMERAQLEALKRATQSGEISKEEAAKLRNNIIKSSAEVLMGRGAGRHQIQRAPYMIEGYETDNALQMYDDYMTSTAGMLSKALYAKEQFENFRYADPSVKQWAEPYIKNTLRNMGHADRISGNARAIATFMYLGGKVSSILINGTQVWTLGVAELGRRTKQNSVKAIGKAQADIMRGKLSADETDLFKSEIWKLQEMETAVNEMSGANEGTTGKLSLYFHTLVGKAMMPFQEMELLNRRTMILAAYRAGMADGMSKRDAVDFALDVNRKTNFEMSRANLPAWAAQYAVGRTIYALQSFVWNNWNWVYNRATSGEKEDMKALLKYAAMLSLIGGVSALAGGDELDKLYRRMFGRSVKMDLQQWTRSHLKEYGFAGDRFNAFLWHGTAGAFGLNISNAMRLNVPMSGFVTGESSAGESAMGIWSGLFDKGVKTIDYASKGQFARAAESAAPTALAAPMTAYRMATKGATTSHGEPVFDDKGRPVKYSAAEASARALGFQPLGQSERAEVSRSLTKINAYWNEQRQDLLDGVRAGTATTRDIQKFNIDLRKSQAFPKVGLINAKTLVAARKAKPDKKSMAQQRNQLD